jgi:hypothetical protein
MVTRTRTMALLVLVIGTLAVGLVRAAPVAGQATPAASEAETAAKIASAMSAALASVADHATILDNELDANGKFVVLREGDNGWFCWPDAYGTPGPDPVCADQAWLDWTYAFIAGKAPETKTPGLAYMLQGGSDASNTDPSATEPEAGNEWMASPPHIMVLLPGTLDQTVLSTDPHNGGPWIMWAGTPYEHIMMPVAEAMMGEMAEATPAA